jgi:hypothetical protein
LFLYIIYSIVDAAYNKFINKNCFSTKASKKKSSGINIYPSIYLYIYLCFYEYINIYNIKILHIFYLYLYVGKVVSKVVHVVVDKSIPLEVWYLISITIISM